MEDSGNFMTDWAINSENQSHLSGLISLCASEMDCTQSTIYRYRITKMQKLDELSNRRLDFTDGISNL